MNRLYKFPSTIWRHKKKTLFAVGVLAFSVDYFNRFNRDQKIRTFYAKEAKKYGDQLVSPLQKIARVTVLINREANHRKVADLFEKNALPLLHLAGLAVTVIKVKDKKQMESLVSVLDRSEADYVFSVGGDGTLSVVLTAMVKKKLESGEANLPLCAFPGGKENRFLTSMVPGIFGEKEDVRRYCESAMAIIENTRKFVHPVRCNIINHSEEDAVDTSYLLSSLNAGWFEHCEQKKHKLWYWGSLKSKVVYAWEFLKRFPQPISFAINYENCDGCNKCREAIKVKPDSWNQWLRKMLGAQKKKNDQEPQVDYSKITNPDCGSLKNLSLNATDIRISCLQQKDGSKLNFESGGAKLGRFASMAAGFQRGASSNKDMPEDITDNKFQASKILLQFEFIPAFIQYLSISGDWSRFEDFAQKTVLLEATNEKIDMFMPKSSKRRIDV